MRRPLTISVATLVSVGLARYDDENVPTVPETPRALTWSQGFDRNTVGRYGGATEGPRGFCGPVTRETGDTGDVEPSEAAIPAGAPWVPGPV